jgi:hypothetical protein
MTLLKKAALPFLLAIGIGAPGAHAVTITTPLVSNPGNITNSGTNLPFLGFSSTFKTANSIPLNAILTNVRLTIKGNTGGTITAINYSPTASAFNGASSLNTFKLTSNGGTLGDSNLTSSPAIPGAVLSPVYTPGGPVTANITSELTSMTNNIFSGLFDFTTLNLSLPVVASFSPVFTSGGPDVSSDGSLFSLTTPLTDTYLTYDYVVPNSVPGPLPLVGGMTAFAFSRRLRRRISSAAL